MKLEIDFIESVFFSSLCIRKNNSSMDRNHCKETTTANHLTASFWDYPYLFVRILWWWVSQIFICIFDRCTPRVQWLRLNLWDFHFKTWNNYNGCIIRREEKEELQHILWTKWEKKRDKTEYTTIAAIECMCGSQCSWLQLKNTKNTIHLLFFFLVHSLVIRFLSLAVNYIQNWKKKKKRWANESLRFPFHRLTEKSC